MSNSVTLTLVESLQSTLFDVFDVCGFGDVARPMLNLGVDFRSVNFAKPDLPVEAANPKSNSEMARDPSAQSSVPNLSSNLLPGVIILVLHFTAVGLTAGDFLCYVPRPIELIRLDNFLGPII